MSDKALSDQDTWRNLRNLILVFIGLTVAMALSVNYFTG
jgi:hypothetical protein